MGARCAQFLGTAAAEGYPDPFCGCERCRRAQALGGPNLRKRSALLLDGELLIDLGPDVLAAMRALGGPLDVVVMDHTMGFGKPGVTHLNAAQFRDEIARLRAAGLLADDARIYATHIAHHSNPSHDELVAEAAAHGYPIAHDGLVIDIRRRHSPRSGSAQGAAGLPWMAVQRRRANQPRGAASPTGNGPASG